MVILAILISAFVVRLYNLSLFPLNHDEVRWHLWSTQYFDKFLGLPVACFHGYIPSIFCYLVAFSKKIFLNPEYIVRIPAIALGLATIIALYALGTELYGRKTGLISAALLCFLPWHVIQSRVGTTMVLPPLFGCLIFLSLYKAVHQKNDKWFLSSCFLLGTALFYTYQSSLLFLPIFLASILWLRKEPLWLKPKTALLGIILFAIIVFPFLYLFFTGKLTAYGQKVMGMFYPDYTIKQGLAALFLKAYENAALKFVPTLKGIFFTKAWFQFGRALEYPLLVHPVSFFLVLASIAVSLYRRKPEDKILLLWLALGYLGGIAGVRFGAERYYFTVIMPPLLIFSARIIAALLNYHHTQRFLVRIVLKSLGFAVFVILFSSSLWQLVTYYYKAPQDFEECRYNSYGCREAAAYLSKIPEIRDYEIRQDVWMEPLKAYLGYFLYGDSSANNFLHKEAKGTFFVVWAPDSHSEDYRKEEFDFQLFYKHFRQSYPDATPEKIIFYPNGVPALYIFGVPNQKF
ncbi:MAG: glycosyltransferase family 39 protein [Candidatus Omnitrophica bacterium]|nr:glycosyltransferase family 39 protein [Candidatus Omnitrophota bacterium]